MPTIVSEEWWIDEPALPDLLWARLRVFDDGRAEVLDADGSVRVFPCRADAANDLAEDEYQRSNSLDPQELQSLGLAPQDVVPPMEEQGSALVARMRSRCDTRGVIRDLAAVQWQQPWRQITREEREQLEGELRRKLHPGHSLHGRRAQAYLRRSDRDDALFILSDPVQLAVVHLACGGNAAHPSSLPSAELYEHVWQFVAQTFVDAAAYAAG